MNYIIKRKMIGCFAIFLIVIFGFGFVFTKDLTASTTAPLGITVAIDAGHGGLDGGSVGVSTGITERDLNIVFAKKLTKYLEDLGITVVNTRLDKNGLYKEVTDDYKLVDMKNRADIINNSNAQILVSIHMNKFSDQSQNGAQVFFEQGNEDSKNLAESIKNILTANFENARKLVLAGDYYILNETKPIGVIVECGFLSNPEEEKLLQNDEYQNKMCYSIYCGIINYLGITDTIAESQYHQI